MRTVLRIACSLAVAALVAAAPSPASAVAKKKITIRPNALSPLFTQQSDICVGAWSGGANLSRWASLKLPVGAKITGLSYRHKATSGSQSKVELFRVQPGKVPSRQLIYEGQATDISPSASIGTIVNGAFAGPTKKVQSGWDYYVTTFTEDEALIGDITVKYETP